MTHPMIRALLLVGGALLVAPVKAAMPASEQSRLLTRADVYSRTPETCPAAAGVMRRFSAHCTGAICEAAQPTLAAIRERCAASIDVVLVPSDGRLEWDPVWVGRRGWLASPRIAAVWPDGSRRSRALCVIPGEEGMRVELAREGDERAVDESQPAAALAAAHERAGLAHLRASEHCEAAAAFEASYAVVPAPRLLLDIARAHDARPGGCLEALAAYDGFLAACPECEEAPAARAGREAASARCAIEPRHVEPPPETAASEPRRERRPTPKPKPKPKPHRPFPSEQLAIGAALIVVGGGFVALDVAGATGRDERRDGFGRDAPRDATTATFAIAAAVGLWLCLDGLIADEPHGLKRWPSELFKSRAVEVQPAGVLIRF
ncbi:MAG: hypothetical protein H6701_14700 [Myxococcales bacterium]|nr:hypothetical protein [Myxococcales bacterium]